MNVPDKFFFDTGHVSILVAFLGRGRVLCRFQYPFSRRAHCLIHLLSTDERGYEPLHSLNILRCKFVEQALVPDTTA